MFLKHIDLTTALRPSYLPDEVLLFVQDNVGLYEGKYKLPNQQNGQVYLTSHRICYVDKAEPRVHSVALDLKDVDRYEFYAGFLRSSPKVTIFPKPLKHPSLRNRAASSATTLTRDSSTSPSQGDSIYRPPSEPPNVSIATWLCTICSFSNPVPSNFDPAAASIHTPLPPCLACGIKPSLSHVLKAAITSANNRPPPSLPNPSTPSPISAQPKGPASRPVSENLGGGSSGQDDTSTSFPCPRCTFGNHPSLLSCEICGASLVSNVASSLPSSLALDPSRTMSPGPVLDQGKQGSPGGIDVSESIKISFRVSNGGDKIFYERLKGAMTQRKWLLQNAPPAPRSNRLLDDGTGSRSPDGTNGRSTKTAGIAGLEQLGLNMRKNNEMIIGSAFEDLEALMASAKDVIALAERFARQTGGGGGSAEENALLAESATQLGLVITKDIAGGSGSESLYLSELSRNVAEFLTDDSRGVLKKAGGIITLVDLWAKFNRARGGVELVSPKDFEKAARMWEKLKLPVRLRTFRSGVMVVQGRDRTDEVTIKGLVSWLDDLHEFPPERDVPWEWREFGRGVTAQETAERFGWSLGVAEEELLMAEEQGALCREEGLEGLKFWKNYISHDMSPAELHRPTEEEVVLKILKESGFL
ncbi:EAP30/Vps36 family-domain-containing protein [Stachybotrys elegans]|uniref:Vacuolar protein-sorting-associated protein 36 n=1 Tax=Stachybotrys elegans TaxID=80388 RepID=A0A8K0WR75_9HYPO|nr:EAP30/Vps36 family-domain-containing protein [Stachybotrys elegans]